MSWWAAPFYDWAMRDVEEACLADWRRALLSDVAGRILEIGAGTGATVGLYPAEVEHLTFAEPDAGMRSRLETKLAQQAPAFPTSIDSSSAEALGFEDESFDTVVVMLCLCTVGDVGRSLAELHRVLKPGGELVFMEHVAAEEGTSRRRWQSRVDPLWTRFAGGCHLNRETESAILSAGFQVLEIQRESMRAAIPLVRPTIRGRARRP
jgi:ubiquinone/menaquinone biosynthesis C-methylase UbiE